MPLNIKNHRELIALARQDKISVETLAIFYEIAVDQLEKLTPIKTDDKFIPATYEKVSSPVGLPEYWVKNRANNPNPTSTLIHLAKDITDRLVMCGDEMTQVGFVVSDYSKSNCLACKRNSR